MITGSQYMLFHTLRILWAIINYDSVLLTNYMYFSFLGRKHFDACSVNSLTSKLPKLFKICFSLGGQRTCSSCSFKNYSVSFYDTVMFSICFRRCSFPMTNYYKDLLCSFSAQLSPSEPTLPVLYGVVMTLCHLGGEVSLYQYY